MGKIAVAFLVGFLLGGTFGSMLTAIVCSGRLVDNAMKCLRLRGQGTAALPAGGEPGGAMKKNLFLIIVFLVLVGCGDGGDQPPSDPVIAPQVMTDPQKPADNPAPAAPAPIVSELDPPEIVAVTTDTATVKGNIRSTGGEKPTWRGFVYGIYENPDLPAGVNEWQAVDGPGSFGDGEFTLVLRGLGSNTRYYVKPFANSSAGTGYGAQAQFTTKEPPPLTKEPDPVSPPPPVQMTNRCVAFGDSITFGVETSTPYVGILSGMLGKPVVNEGTDGGTSSVGREIISGLMATYNPDCVTIYYGTNDSGFRDPGWTADNLRIMVRVAGANGARVAIATLQPAYGKWAWRQPYLKDLSNRIREIAASEGVRCADVERAFNGDSSLIGADGLHPTDRGHRIIAETFNNALR